MVNSDTVQAFITANDRNFTLGTIPSDEKQDLLAYCLQQIEPQSGPISVNCLRCLRILTRADELVDKLTTDPLLSQFVALAFCSSQSQPDAEDARAESLKCLLNLSLKCRSIVAKLSSLGLIDRLLSRLNDHVRSNSRSDVLLFDLKLLFLLSGVDPAVRHELCQRNEVFRQLRNLLDAMKSSKISNRDSQFVSEILKTAYNIGYGIQHDAAKLEERIPDFDAYCAILRNYLVQLDFSVTDQLMVVQNIVNFFNVLPKRSFCGLLFSTRRESDFAPRHAEMEAVDVLINYLDLQLPQPVMATQVEHTTRLNGGHLKESLCPIVNTLIRACQGNRSIRKYCRTKILPHLGAEVTRLPEEGTTLRNRLCKLLTNPVHDVSELIALFLFILCKEDIGRAIKYTGFGNFAGFLARHALLGSACKKRVRSAAATATDNEPSQSTSESIVQDSAEEYSSTSSESDTEEYDRLKDMVNPVTGRWETEKADPFEGMPESQKEVLVMELVRDIDRLQRDGIIQPGKVSEGGRIEPVGHVLELLEGTHTPEKEESD